MGKVDVRPEAVADFIHNTHYGVPPSHRKITDLLEALSSALAQAVKERDEAKRQWRCFFCGEVFTDETAARAHFGDYDDDCGPLCKMAAVDPGLAIQIGQFEAEIDSMRDDRQKLDQILDVLGIADSDIDPAQYVKDGFAQRDSALSQLAEARGENAWRPIESAPKDGSAFLAYGVHTGSPLDAQKGVVAGDHWWAIILWDKWREPQWVFSKDGKPTWTLPTYWRPLPTPPPAEGEGR